MDTNIISTAQYNVFKAELKELLEKYNVDIGIYSEEDVDVELDIEFQFKHRVNGKATREHIRTYTNGWLCSTDL